MTTRKIAAINLVSALVIAIAVTACSRKPSDSNVGRVTEPDGFAVKTFMIAKCTELTPAITDSLRTLMRRIASNNAKP